MQDRQLLVSLQPPEPLGGFLHGCPGPAERHRGIPPVLHVAANPPDRAHHVLGRWARAAAGLGARGRPYVCGAGGRRDHPAALPRHRAERSGALGGRQPDVGGAHLAAVGTAALQGARDPTHLAAARSGWRGLPRPDKCFPNLGSREPPSPSPGHVDGVGMIG